MPTNLSSLFVRGRSHKGDVAAFGLRLVSALLTPGTWPRSLEGALRLALRHRNCQVAVAVTVRRADGKARIEPLAGRAVLRNWRRLGEALTSRQSPLQTVGSEAVWIRMSDDQFQPGAPALRHLDLQWMLVLPFTLPEGADDAFGAIVLGGDDRATDERHPLLRLATLIWMIARERVVVAEAEPAADDLWDQAPVAMAVVSPHQLVRINAAARELLTASLGPDRAIWSRWLQGVVQRLEMSGLVHDTVRASQSRDLDLDVTLGSGVGPAGERQVALAVATTKVADPVDHEATMRSLGHELRTPLTAMNTSLDLVLRGDTGDLNDDQTRFLGATKRNLERLNRLLADLLESKRAEAGEASLHLATVDLGERLHQDLALFVVAAEEKGLELRIDTVPDSFAACVDADKMQQVLHNLLTNALKYTPRGGLVRVGLADEGARTPGLGMRLAEHFGLSCDAFTLSVQDSGMGMSEDYLQQLFEPFRREQRRETGVVPGVGLGLHITRGLVEAHGGEVRLVSELGRGTTVWVVLPREPGSSRVLTVGRQLGALSSPTDAADLLALDLRDRTGGAVASDLDITGRYVRNVLADLARRDGLNTVGGALGWALAPGLWVASAQAGPRLGPAWEVATAAPECPVILADTTWQPVTLTTPRPATATTEMVPTPAG